MIYRLQRRGGRYNLERRQWQQKSTISPREVEGALGEEDGEISAVEASVEEAKGNQRIVPDAVSRTIGVESAQRRIASVHGVEEKDTLS